MDILAIIKRSIDDAPAADLSALGSQSRQKALETGLGPYLAYCVENGRLTAPQALIGLLSSADLTSRVLTEALLDALEEIIRHLLPICREITLLKGISICQTHYPSPHLRPMGDIDLLIPREHHPAAEERLRRLGYIQKSDYPPAFYQTLHHRMPFYHPEHGVWVEIHHTLFPPSSELSSDRYFTNDSISRHTTPHLFRGLTCQRLDDEFLLAYTCAHWAERLNMSRGSIALLDMVLLLRNGPTPFPWRNLIEQVKGSICFEYLSLAILYLEQRELVQVPKDIEATLLRQSKHLNWLNRKILGWILNRHIARGMPCGRFLSASNIALIWEALLTPRAPVVNLLLLPWSLLFPPKHPARWSVRFQLGRLASLFGWRH